jgi:NADPH:quinone reductase-like Zn-dependent oxidoreductase
MVRAYSITAEAIAQERERAGDDLKNFDISRVIRMDKLELPEVGPGDVRLRILAVSAEHNVDHAALADTINIVEMRGGKIYPGNSAVAEVTEVGSNVKRFRPGQIVITHANGEPDAYGYPLRIWAYDQPESRGWYCEEAVVADWQIVAAPLECGLNLWELAALPLRAPTAYHLWRRAEGIFRLKVSRERLARMNVLGFGGGVSELFLMLAISEGHRVFFCSGNAARRAHLEGLGAESIDQGGFNRFAARDDVRGFSRRVKEVTEGVGMHIVCDMLRGSVFQAGIAALAREGVNISAGWQLGQRLQYDSAAMSVKQLTLDHVHLNTIEEAWAATPLYGTVFRPAVHREIYAFEDLPRAMQEMNENTQTGIPIIRVAEQMPEAVRPLIEG